MEYLVVFAIFGILSRRGRGYGCAYGHGSTSGCGCGAIISCIYRKPAYNVDQIL